MATKSPSRPSLLKVWGQNDNGSTSAEFAMMSIPLLMFVFGAFAVAMHFFTTSALEHAVDVASRELRTGQAHSSATTNAEFKQKICDSGFVDCDKLVLHVSSDDAWNNVTPALCADEDGNLLPGTGASAGLVSDQGGCAGRAYVVTACYEWDLAKAMPFIDVGTLSNGAGLIQASAAGRSEPHEFACN